MILFSIHEADRWPRTGKKGDFGGGNAHNYPLARGSNDNDLNVVINTQVLPLLSAFAPEFIVLQAGADGLKEDPQSGLCYTNKGYWLTISTILNLNIPILVLGGGGYNPFTTARAWTGVWGLMIGKNPHKTECVSESLSLIHI